jgi:hypothetical protein
MRQFADLPIVVERILAGQAVGCLVIVRRQTGCLASGETASGWMRQDTWPRIKRRWGKTSGVASDATFGNS